MKGGNQTGKALVKLFATVCCLALLPELSSAAWTAEGELLPAGRQTGDNYGREVSISGGLTIVGAMFDDTVRGTNAGSAYVWQRGSTGWWEVGNPLPLDGSDHDVFGDSVSISGLSAIAGAPGSGSVYAITRDALGGWREYDRPAPTDGVPLGDSVSTTDDGWIAIAGATRDSANGLDAGSAYIFTRSDITGLYTQRAKLLPDDGQAGDEFGVSVSIADYTVGSPTFGSNRYRSALVGAFHDDDNGQDSGSAYPFTDEYFSSWDWRQGMKYLPEDGAAGDLFGYSVSLDGDGSGHPSALIGAPGDDNANGADAGAAYIFHGDFGLQVAKLLAGDGEAGDELGMSVALYGGTAVVGAPGRLNANRGAAYVFVRNPSGDWVQTDKLVAPDGGTSTDQFGVSVSISDDTIVVGAPFHAHAGGPTSGSAYVFKRNPFVTVDLATEVMISVGGGSSTAGGLHVAFEEVIERGSWRGEFFRPADPKGLHQLIGPLATDLIQFPFASDPFQVWQTSFDGEFSGEATMWFGYDETSLLVPEELLQIQQFVDGKWRLPDQVLDSKENMIQVTVDGFGPFVLSAVPEPCTLVLLAVGGLAVLVRCPRRRFRSPA